MQFAQALTFCFQGQMRSFGLHLCEIGEHRYLRLHGRNRAAWFDKKAGRDDTYNYLYSIQELDKIKQRVLALAKTSRSLTLVGNNHYQGKEVANVLQLKAMLSGGRTAFPPGVVARYPDTRPFARERENLLPGFGS